MRKSALLCGIALAATFIALPAGINTVTGGVAWTAASAATNVSIDVFFNALEPYGAWVPSTNYNYIWIPSQVPADWSPYSNGHWIYTDQYGWYFVSDEAFAPIVYHYGRWGYDPVVGWYWVPGTEWAGAWVTWRRSDTNIGWAPLPPDQHGYAVSVSITVDTNNLPTNYWRFVASNQFLAPQLSTVAVRGDRDPDRFKDTPPVGSVKVVNNIVINNVIDLNFIQTATKQKVVPATVEQVADPKLASAPAAGNQGSIKAFIGTVTPPAATAKPSKVTAQADVTAPTKGQAPAAAGATQTPAGTTATGTVTTPPTGTPPAGATPPTGTPPAGGTPPTGTPPSGATPPTGTPPSGATPPTGTPPSGATPPTGTPPSGATPPTGTPPSGATPPTGTPPSGATPPTGTPPAGGTPPTGTPPSGATPPTGTPPAGGTPPTGTPPAGATPPTGTPPSGGTPPTGTPPSGATPPTGAPPAGGTPPAPKPPGTTTTPPAGNGPAGTTAAPCPTGQVADPKTGVCQLPPPK